MPPRRDTQPTTASDTSGEPIRDEHYVTGTARQYKEAYPWVDQAAIEANLAVHVCYWAAQEAHTRLLSALGYGRTIGRVVLLRALHFAEGGSLTQSEIASKLMITSASVTFLVDGLEKEGLVVRRPSKSDRRMKRVELTEEGQAACEHVVPAIANLVSTFFDGFSEDEKQTMYQLLMRFWQNAARDIEHIEELAAEL